MSRARVVAAVGAALLAASCSSILPWKKSADATANEVNLSFTVENNLLFLSSGTIDGKPGRFFFGSAEPRSVLNRPFAASLGGPKPARTFGWGERQTATFSPVELDLGNAGDAMIGADVFAGHSVTVDYRAGLITYQESGIFPGYMTLFNYDAEPAINATVDGRDIAVVVDTASPDTLTLPRASAGRGRSHVAIAGTDFGSVDVGFADVARPRIGNRLLSKFLVSIDYRRRVVGLWRDPRIP